MDSYQTILGSPREAIDTPSLVIDLDALDRNIKRMADFFATVPANLRPHSKTHKTPIISRKQIEAGAKGITCAKVGEAEVMVQGGIDDILIANEVVGPTKIARLVGLARHAKLTVAVDDPRNVADLSEAAQAAGATLGILVEVNVGLDRCGVEPGEPALALARRVLESRGLRLRGLMGYEGHTVSIPDRAQREEAARKAMSLLVGTRDLLVSRDVPVEVVSAGGTGTYDITGRYPGVTEVEAGSYATMDGSYAKVGLPFEHALTILATVISRSSADRAILDCGLKAMTPEFGVPQPKDRALGTISKLSEEHSRLDLAPGADPRPGEKIEIIPQHGCTTINLHDRFYGVREGRVETVWEIQGRGKFR